MTRATRREFLGEIGHGMLVASLGSSLAGRIRACPAHGGDRPPRVRDDLEALIARMQAGDPADLMPYLVSELKAGTKLSALVTAGALANTRTFGGSDYEGYHAFMALLPAYFMAQQLPQPTAPLPVLKVLYRNSARIRAAGPFQAEAEGTQVPAAVEAAAATDGGALALRQRVRERDLAGAERLFARACSQNLDAAYEDIQHLVADDLNVHRVVLAWRAWDMRQLAGTEHAQALLRQMLRFCVDEENSRVKRGAPPPAVRDDVPRILEQHGLLTKALGERVPDDAWVDELAGIVFGDSRVHAAEAVAAALAKGYAADAVAEAIALGANRLLLHNTGAKRVHGASVGVHASDAANAWRNVAGFGSQEIKVTSLVVGAYHTAGQSEHVGKEAYSYADALARLQTKDPAELLRAAATAIEQRDQQGACAAVRCYGDAGHPAEPMIQLLLRYAISEDGALHAEKYFHTAREEFHRARPAFRWRHLVALARVTASEFGEPAPGVAQARKLLEG